MKTIRLALFGIPAHPVVNDAPGTLLPVASMCDLCALAGDETWFVVAFRTLQLGNISAIVAALLGLLDFLRLPPAPAVRRLGVRHAGMNLLALPLFFICQWQRRQPPHRPSRAGIALLAVANIVLNLAAAHGAKLVHTHGVRTHEADTWRPLTAVPEPVTW